MCISRVSAFTTIGRIRIEWYCLDSWTTILVTELREHSNILPRPSRSNHNYRRPKNYSNQQVNGILLSPSLSRARGPEESWSPPCDRNHIGLRGRHLLALSGYREQGLSLRYRLSRRRRMQAAAMNVARRMREKSRDTPCS